MSLVYMQAVLGWLRRRARGDGVPDGRGGAVRIQALCQALTGFAHVVAGVRHRDLRPRVAAVRSRSYSAAQMTYDLRRLRLRGLIQRQAGTHRDHVTSASLRVLLLQQAVSSDCSTSGPGARRFWRSTSPSLDPRSTNSTPPSNACIKRLRLLPEKFVSTRTRFPVGSG